MEAETARTYTAGMASAGEEGMETKSASAGEEGMGTTSAPPGEEDAAGTNKFTVKWFADKMPPLSGGDQARYKLDGFADLISQLLETAVSVIKDLGFGAFLDISMLKLPDKQFAIWTASLCKPATCHNEDAIVFILDENCPLVMTRRALPILIGLPMGEQVVPCNLLECPTDGVKDALKAALKATSGKTQQWSLQDVTKACTKARSEDDHMLQVRLFIAAVFEFAIFTTASHYLSAQNLEAVSDIQKLVKTNWCEKLIALMTKCLKTFDESRKVNSPVSFVLAAFCLENIDCAKTKDKDAMKIPRLKYYTEAKMLDIIAAVKKGVKLKDWKNTVYGRNAIQEVQADEIAYIENYKEEVKRRKVLKEDKGPSKEEDKGPAKEDKGPLKKRPRLHKESNDESNNHDQFSRAGIDRDVLRLYQEHVLGRTRDEIILNILNHEVSELNYVECFKLRGYMHTSIMFLQCALWNQEWKDKAMNKVILSHKAVYELLDPKKGTSMLADELGLQANLIFIPIIHDHHWFLIVISRNKTIYILDSCPSESRESVISGILSTLKKQLEKSTAGSDYISKVLKVQPQKNNYDCGFHVLLYIKGFDDTQAEQICGVNKDMVEKFRIETSIDLLRHKLNKRAKVVTESNDDDDVEVVENNFSYDNFVFNAALHGEWEKDVFSTPSFMDGTERVPLNVLSGFETLAEGSNLEAASGDNAKAEGGAGKEEQESTKNRGKKRAASGDNAKAEGSNLEAASRDNAKAEGGAGKEEQTSQNDVQVYDRKKGQKRKKPKPKVSSAVMPSACERQRRPHDFSVIYNKSRRFSFEVLEQVHKLAIDCKQHVILSFEEISMTGPQLQKCLQGGEDARDLIILLTKFLDKAVKDTKIIFVSPLEKDDEHLEEKIKRALPFMTNRRSRASTSMLSQTIIYCPIFFEGEWIVVCFVLLGSNQIRVCCHKDSFNKVKQFYFSLRDVVSKAVKEHGYNEVTFSKEKVAYTASTIKANDSAFASTYFLENFHTPAEKHFNKFSLKTELLNDFIEAVKLGLLPFLLSHKNNNAVLPDTIAGLIKKKI